MHKDATSVQACIEITGCLLTHRLVQWFNVFIVYSVGVKMHHKLFKPKVFIF